MSRCCCAAPIATDPARGGDRRAGGDAEGDTAWCPPGQECTVLRALPHGHVAAVAAMARQLGLPALLGPAGRSRDLVLGLIISRVIHPASKLSTLSRWGDCTLGPDLQIAGASTDEVYAAMDWLGDRQDAQGVWPRASFRSGRVRNETVANLSMLIWFGFAR